MDTYNNHPVEEISENSDLVNENGRRSAPTKPNSDLVNGNGRRSAPTKPNSDLVNGGSDHRNAENASSSANASFVYTNENNRGNILTAGSLIAGKYTVIRKLNKESGEADIYLAEHEANFYAVKVYRYQNVVTPEVLEILKSIDHPNLPRIVDTGEVEGRQFEVTEYYRKGSLEGVILTEEEVRKHFLPDMNEALHMLDQMNIVHKDIKPANIAKKEDGHYVLMDFGISSVRENGAENVSANLGITIDYAAPESMGMGSSWSVLSDYYSLGVTIYELLLGRLPYDGMEDEEKAQYRRLNKFPFPNTVSEDFQTLILGLTYNDTTNRDDPTNINNRWNYSFVCDWLRGKKMTPPGTGVVKPEYRPFQFEDTMCSTQDELMIAFAHNWNTAQKYLARDLVSAYLRREGMTKLCNDCIDAANAGTDEALMKLIYSNTSELNEICWKNTVVKPKQLGKMIQEKLWSCMNVYDRNNMEQFKDILDIVKSGVISMFYRAKSKGSYREDNDEKKAVRAEELSTRIVKAYRSNDTVVFYDALFRLGFFLEQKCRLRLGPNLYFEDYDSFLQAFESNMMNSELKSFEQFIDKIVRGYSDGSWEYSIPFIAWCESLEEV